MMYHRNKLPNALLGVFVAIGLAFAPAVAAANNEEEAESPEEYTRGLDMAGEHRTSIALSEVPDVVMATARRSAPDVFFNKAERFLAEDVIVYRVSGRLFREVWDVYVRANGTLLRADADNQDD